MLEIDNVEVGSEKHRVDSVSVCEEAPPPALVNLIIF